MMVADDEVHAQLPSIADLLMSLDAGIHRYNQSSTDAMGIVYPLPRDPVPILVPIWNIISEKSKPRL